MENVTELPVGGTDSKQQQQTDQSKCNNDNENKGGKEQRILSRDDFYYAFNTQAYLKDFYSGKIDEAAMRLILAFLPNVVARLTSGLRVLDVGAGPTIHVAVCFRKKADEIYLSDYLPQNREELVRWVRNQSRFDWSTVLKIIATQEGDVEQWHGMELIARRKV